LIGERYRSNASDLAVDRQIHAGARTSPDHRAERVKAQRQEARDSSRKKATSAAALSSSTSPRYRRLWPGQVHGARTYTTLNSEETPPLKPSGDIFEGTSDAFNAQATWQAGAEAPRIDQKSTLRMTAAMSWDGDRNRQIV
jgi:hypothetical protein